MRNDGLIAFRCNFSARCPDKLLLRILRQQPLPDLSFQDVIGVFDKVTAYALSSTLLRQCEQLAVSQYHFLHSCDVLTYRLTVMTKVSQIPKSKCQMQHVYLKLSELMNEITYLDEPTIF